MMASPLAERRVLEGKRILVTRAAHQAAKLSDGLRALGAEPVEVPVLEIRAPENPGPLDRALRQFSHYDWLIFTSANTVRAVVERAAALGVSITEAQMPQVAAVGEATAAAARNAGFSVAVVPETYVAESLIASLAEQTANKKILLARAVIARDVIPDALRAAGAEVVVVDAYRNVLPESAAALLQAALDRGIDAATFTSSSSVTHLAEAARIARIRFPFAGVPAISIGPVTSATLRELGCEPAAEARRFDIPGLIAATVSIFSVN
jgi:uroporphyrinogen-III synthase